VTRVQHVNVVVPSGATEECVAFYVDVLGMRRIEKPKALDPRGAWLDVDGVVQVHLSEREGSTHPDSHFAVVVDDFAGVLAMLEERGMEWTEQEDVFGGRRGFTRDPAGNRVEILETA